MPTVNQMVRKGRKNNKTKSKAGASVHFEQLQAAPRATG